MVLHKLDELEDYVRFLQSKPAEVEALYQDILISVTSFFRDPEAFEALKSKVFPRLLKNRPATTVRIWVLGCSTGRGGLLAGDGVHGVRRSRGRLQSRSRSSPPT